MCFGGTYLHKWYLASYHSCWAFSRFLTGILHIEQKYEHLSDVWTDVHNHRYKQMASDLMSERRQSIIRFISQYQIQHGYAPSLREVAKAMRLKSPSSVLNHLRVLEKGGVIARTPKQPRSLHLLVTPEFHISDPRKGERDA